VRNIGSHLISETRDRDGVAKLTGNEKEMV